jgi:hypothetical protein
VHLAWTATTTPFAAGYAVYRSTASGGPYSFVANVSGRTTTTYDDTPPDGTFYYVVRATYSGSSSVNSGQAGPVTSLTLDHFEFATIADQNNGRSFSITVRARTVSNALVTGFTQTVALTTNSGTISPTTSSAFSGGVLTQTVTVTGPAAMAYNAAQTITATGGPGAKTGTSASFKLHDWVYWFKKTTANIATNCTAGIATNDMDEGYLGADPDATMLRSGGTGSVTFCTPTFAAGQTLPAVDATVTMYAANAAGSGCRISAVLSKNGVTDLGTGFYDVASGQGSGTPLTFTVSNNGTTFAAGDRLDLELTWANVKACASTTMYWGGTVHRSRIALPVP